MKQAIVLAAGRGSRLGSATDGNPKCLVRVGGKTLLEHHVQALHAVGVERICVVIGHQSQRIEQLLNGTVEYVHNPRWDQTNSLYSLWSAREWIQGEFMLMNCDVLAHPDVFARVASAQGTALAYDSTSGDEDEHMKVSVRNGCVRAITKKMVTDQICGENVGILRFDEQGGQMLFEAADVIVKSGLDEMWAPAAVNQIATTLPIAAIDVAGLPWVEIDFAHDLEYAHKKIWPEIKSAMTNSLKESQ